MKKTFYIIFGLAIIVVIAGWMLAPNVPNVFWQSEGNTSSVDNVLKTAEMFATLAIDYGDGETENFQIDFTEGATVFDLLRDKADELGLNLKTKTYDIGVLVEAIGDKENGQDGKYWLYYVNEQLPMVASDKMEVKEGDKIEFKFEKSTF